MNTDKQTTENQKIEIENYAKVRVVIIDEWIEETISAIKKLDDRKFGQLYKENGKRRSINCNRIIADGAEPNASNEYSSQLHGKGYFVKKQD